jgi:iron(III) transport system substrate-binding protein
MTLSDLTHEHPGARTALVQLTRRGLGAVGLVALLWLAACGTSSEKPPSDGGHLEVLCTVEEGWCKVMVAAFEAKTGIATTYERLGSGDAVAALVASKADPKYSVWWGGSADGYVAAQAAGVLAAYKSPNASGVPAASKDADGAWTGVYAGVLGFCSNRAELAKLGLGTPTSWQDLLNPALKGRVSIAHPSSSGTAYTALSTLMTLNRFDEAATFSYLTALDGNVAAYTRSGAAPAGLAASGTAAVAVVFAHDCATAIDAGAKDLVISFPREGTGFETGATALVKGAPNAEAGKKWIDWALTAEAQELGAEAKAYQIPLNPDAKVPTLSVKLSTIALVDYNFTKAGAQRQALTSKFEAQIAAPPK